MSEDIVKNYLLCRNFMLFQIYLFDLQYFTIKIIKTMRIHYKINNSMFVDSANALNLITKCWIVGG